MYLLVLFFKKSANTLQKFSNTNGCIYIHHRQQTQCLQSEGICSPQQNLFSLSQNKTEKQTRKNK